MALVEANSITLSNTTFMNNKTITNVDCNYVSWVNNSMYKAFNNCTNLISVSNINENVTSMYQTFRNCYNLVNTPVIPNSVTDMLETFSNCSNIVNAPNIPNSVSDIRYTFSSCSNLVNAPVIPNSVVNMSWTFSYCSNLVNAPDIGNSVTDIFGTFTFCSKLVNAPVIPNTVINMGMTFMSCYNLTNAPIIPNSVTNMYETFDTCSNLVNAPIIPNSVTNMYRTFSSCSKLVNAPVIGNSVVDMYRTFFDCRNLINAPIIPNGVVDMRYTFTLCVNLFNAPIIPNSVTNMYQTFSSCYNLVNVPDIPNSIVDMSETFYRCYNLVNAPIIPNSVTNMYRTFTDSKNLSGNIYIQSENITNAYQCFYGSSLTKNVYIPYTYENSEYTKTYNSFINTSYDENGTTNGVYLRDINSNYYTLTINPTPSNATVEMTYNNMTITNNIWSFKDGSTVSYTVSCEDYKTVTNTITLTNDTTINVVLESTLFTVSINPTPSNATVILTADGYTQEGNSIKVKPNTTISYSVSAEGYIEQTGIYTITSNLDLNIVLEEALNTKYNVEDYTYTVNNKILTLTNYIGSETDVIVPIIEQL